MGGKFRTAALAAVVAAVAHPPTAAAVEDDHPLLGRYPGAEIAAAPRTVAYDEIELPAGPVTNNEPAGVLELEGRYTMHAYWGPEGATELVIGRGYEQAFADGGFDVLFSCVGSECGDLTGFLANRTFRDMTSRDLRGRDPINWASYRARPNDRVRAYLARLEREDATAHVFLYISRYYNTSDSMRISQIVVESAPFAPGTIEAGVREAGELQEALEEDGRAVVPGIFFGFDSAELRPESAAALEQMASLLDGSDLQVVIAGHTDNVGGHDYNMDLSAQRAVAVRQALVGTYGIDGARLVAEGRGFTEPVADNDTEEGRQQNRRVEIIAISQQ